MWYLTIKLSWYLLTALVVGLIVGWVTSKPKPAVISDQAN